MNHNSLFTAAAVRNAALLSNWASCFSHGANAGAGFRVGTEVGLDAIRGTTLPYWYPKLVRPLWATQKPFKRGQLLKVGQRCAHGFAVELVAAELFDPT